MTNASELGFPRKVLKKSSQERYDYYRKHTVAHPVIQSAFDKVLDIIHEPAGKQIVMLVGPTRVGKTFLLEWLISEIRSEWAERQASEPGRIPVVSIEIPSRDMMNPSWSFIYERMLRAMEEPLIDKKIVYGDVTLHSSPNGRVKLSERITGGKLRIAVEEAYKYRRPLVTFFDEFHHLLGMAGLGIQDQMDCVKSLANMTHTLLALFGTYEGLDFIDLSDQLTLRSKVVHLRRYCDTEQDLDDFYSTIHSFQVFMPFQVQPDLLKHFDYIYERSVGCVGTLALWLLKAYHHAAMQGAPTLTLQHLKQHVPLSEKQAIKIRLNIEKDEKRFLEIVGEEDIIESKCVEPSAEKSLKGAQDAISVDNHTMKPKTKPKRRPWERLPERDLIGRGTDAT
jgi:AAA domain